MKKQSVAISLLLPFCFYGMVLAQDGRWEVLKTRNTAPNCSECGMAAVNGKLYLIGGDGEGKRAVESFDPKTGEWKRLATAPLPMHHFQAVAYGNKIYVLDAFSEGNFPNQVPMANVYNFDTKKNIWEKGGEIPSARRRGGAAAIEYKGKLYLIAGILHGHASGTNNMFDCYDPEAKTWKSLPDAPNIRDHCSAAVINDKLYVVGGRNTSYRDPENKVPFFAMTMLDVDVYDFNTGTWSTLSARLPLGSGGGALVNLNGILYYMGGERATATEHNAPRKNTFYLDPSTSKQWTETDSLHYARNGMAATVYNNRIYAAGGSGGGPGGPPPNIPNANQAPPGRPDGQMQKSPIDLEVFILK